MQLKEYAPLVLCSGAPDKEQNYVTEKVDFRNYFPTLTFLRIQSMNKSRVKLQWSIMIMMLFFHFCVFAINFSSFGVPMTLSLSLLSVKLSVETSEITLINSVGNHSQSQCGNNKKCVGFFTHSWRTFSFFCRDYQNVPIQPNPTLQLFYSSRTHQWAVWKYFSAWQYSYCPFTRNSADISMIWMTQLNIN